MAKEKQKRKSAKVTLKIKGNPKQVKKALVHFADSEPDALILRDADARTRLRSEGNS